MEANQEKIKELLSQVAQIEYSLLGDRAIENITFAAQSDLTFDEAFKKEEGGLNLDYELTIQILLQSATVVKIGLEVYGILKAKNNDVDDKEFVSEVNKRVKEHKNSFDKVKLVKIIVDVLKLIKEMI